MVSANHASSNSASLPVHTPKEILSANRRRSQTKKTKAFSTGQSWRVLKSGYAAGGPEQGLCAASQTLLTEVYFRLRRRLPIDARKIWFYSHDVIDRPYIRTYVHPSMYANVTSIMLVYSIHLRYWTSIF